METNLIQVIGASLFALALLHTFAAKYFEVLVRRHPKHAEEKRRDFFPSMSLD